MNKTALMEDGDEVEGDLVEGIEQSAREAGHPGSVKPDTAETPFNLVGEAAGTVSEYAGKTANQAAAAAFGGSSPDETVLTATVQRIQAKRSQKTRGG